MHEAGEQGSNLSSTGTICEDRTRRIASRKSKVVYIGVVYVPGASAAFYIAILPGFYIPVCAVV